MIDMAEGITIKEYERAEAELRIEKRHRNFYIHATLYVLINALLIVINLAFLPAYPWFLFPLVFWGIGLLAHYFEAFLWVKSDIEAWEANVEYLASEEHGRVAA
jgi:2TM domain